MSPPPLSLYIHLPWCLRKCPYCDFNSHAVRDEVPEKAYVDALLADLQQELPDVWGRSIETVFIGGGTPSLFSPEALDALLCGVRSLSRLHPDREITLEANPGTFEQAKFGEFRNLGINRLSIGVQSFHDDSLTRLGRVHGAAEARTAAAGAVTAGFENVNLDIMFGLPHQTLGQATQDLREAIALAPNHISWYQLTVEPNTLFHKRRPPLPTDEECWTMQGRGQSLLSAAGYAQYEISAYARAGLQCRHNLNYWRFGDYLGIGAGAHGKITLPAKGKIVRRWKVRHPDRYLTKAHEPARIRGEQTLSPADLALEFALNALRLTEGFESKLFLERTGLPLNLIEPQLETAASRGLLHWDHQRVQTTERGKLFLNELLTLFVK